MCEVQVSAPHSPVSLASPPCPLVVSTTSPYSSSHGPQPSHEGPSALCVEGSYLHPAQTSTKHRSSQSQVGQGWLQKAPTHPTIHTSKPPVDITGHRVLQAHTHV
jgi:hypothetical protein